MCGTTSRSCFICSGGAHATSVFSFRVRCDLCGGIAVAEFRELLYLILVKCSRTISTAALADTVISGGSDRLVGSRGALPGDDLV